jgi:hypothetical protein
MLNAGRPSRLDAASGRLYSAALALALAFLVLHLPYRPHSLEDLDSINFALALRQFDVAHHQPHPPGYPVYIGLGKIARTVSSDEAQALSLVGILSGSVSVIALAALFGGIGSVSSRSSLVATILTITAPLFWFTAIRPLSDTPGLAAALVVQAMTLSATTGSGLVLAAFGAGLATGIRSQVAWLTVPLLVLAIARHCGDRRIQMMRRATLGLVAGSLLWLVPLIWLTGGPSAYWRALFNQGAEDLTGVRMLWTTPTLRQFLFALYNAFVSPWALWGTAVAVVLLALVGVLRLSRRTPSVLFTLTAAFGPYLVFDLLFQETATTRYALPLVVPVAFLAAQGLEAIGETPAIALGVCLAAFNAHIGGTSIAAYAREKSPAFRMLDDMIAAKQESPSPVLAMDRRQDLDLRRPIQWIGERMPQVSQRLPAPPNHEWLELVKHWNSQANEDASNVWFVADPLRTDIDLVQHQEPAEYKWSLPYPILVGGSRPGELRWYRVARPDWYLGEGWALTPEAGGVAQADGRNPATAPIHGWVARSAFQGAMIVGGRNLVANGPRARIIVAAGDEGVQLAEENVPPGNFLLVMPFNASNPIRGSDTSYVKVSIRASTGSQVAIEQFDASAVRPVFGLAEGWHEQEYNPSTGLRWRWLSDRGDIRFHVPPGSRVKAESARRHGIVLHLAGESPLRYFSRPSRLVVRVGGRILRDEMLSSDFSIDAVVPPELMTEPVGTITVETDQIYVPAERSRRTRDRRRLGLRVFKCELKLVRDPAS